MIKINLAKGFSGAGGRAESAANDSGFEDVKKEGVKRLLMICAFPIVMYVYSDFMLLPDLRAQLRSKESYLAELQDKNTRAAGAVEEIRRFKEDQKKLQQQIEKVEKLSKERLREVKILDTIQKDIPEKAWLTRINVNPRELRVEGRATSDSEITLFMDSLQRSIFFRAVNLVKSTEERTEKGLIKAFEIRCELEGAPEPNPQEVYY